MKYPDSFVTWVARNVNGGTAPLAYNDRQKRISDRICQNMTDIMEKENLTEFHVLALYNECLLKDIHPLNVASIYKK